MSQAAKTRKAIRKNGKSQRLSQPEAVAVVCAEALFAGCVSVIAPP
jgi:hypothetical protein